MVLPKPSGPHIVGCADVMTKVLSLPKDINSKFSVIEKEVNFGTFARLYYPTEADSSTKFEEATILPNSEGSLYAESMFSLFKLKWLSRLGSYFLRKIFDLLFFNFSFTILLLSCFIFKIITP